MLKRQMSRQTLILPPDNQSMTQALSTKRRESQQSSASNNNTAKIDVVQSIKIPSEAQEDIQEDKPLTLASTNSKLTTHMSQPGNIDTIKTDDN